MTKLCRNGLHPFHGDNIYRAPNGDRHCRACRKEATERRDSVLLEFTCPECGKTHSKRRKSLLNTARLERRGQRVFPREWCKACVSRTLNLERAALNRQRKINPPPVVKLVPEPDWRTAEEQEKAAEYWTRRYSEAQIRSLAGELEAWLVLDMGGKPARKWRAGRGRAA